MSSATSLPGQLTHILPENGYETPPCLESEGGFFKSDIRHEFIRAGGERRRNIYENSDETKVGDDSLDSRGYLNGDVPMAEKSIREAAPRIIGFRDRVGCYTWTWFTMTMATGGIASVLHSSTEPMLTSYNLI